jgi:cell division protein FtsX
MSIKQKLILVAVVALAVVIVASFLAGQLPSLPQAIALVMASFGITTVADANASIRASEDESARAKTKISNVSDLDSARQKSKARSNKDLAKDVDRLTD